MDIDELDISIALQDAKPWKAAGPDKFPAGFLRACGKPVARYLAPLFNAYLCLGHWSAAFRQVNVAVLPKPRKITAQLQTPGGYRPITLLSCIGKALERILANRLAAAAE